MSFVAVQGILSYIYICYATTITKISLSFYFFKDLHSFRFLLFSYMRWEEEILILY